MGFFRSMLGICRGPYVSRELQKHSWGRTLWHLFLICFFCSVFIGVGNYLLLNYRWRAAYLDFNKIFGHRLKLSERWIAPEIQQKVSRRQELPYNSLLIYVSPEGREKDYPDETLKDRNLIVLWSPAVIAFISRSENDTWAISYLRPDGRRELLTKSSFADMKKELIDLASEMISGPEPEVISSISSRRLFFYVRFLYAFVVALKYFSAFFVILLITFLFSVLFKLFTGERSSGMPFNNLWKISVYTAFPVLFVLSFFPALQLPGVSFFYDLLVIGWAVYLFVVLKYLANNPDDPENDEKVESNESVQ